MADKRVAFVTPTYRRDFDWCVALNKSVLRFLPESVKHYLVVDARDSHLFAGLENDRTILKVLERVTPGGFFRVPGFEKRWCLRAPILPVRGWLVQQVAKIAMASVLDEDIMVMVDSDVTFVRNLDPALFSSPDGLSRLYRRPNGIEAHQANFLRWHRNDCMLLNVSPDEPPMDDYVGNMISWDRRLVLQMCARVESVTKEPWYVAFARARGVSEYLLYGLFVEKVIGTKGNVWVDNRSWCHTYWGRTPIDDSQMRAFVDGMPNDDVAFSIAGYSGTSDAVRHAALDLIRERQLQPAEGRPS